MQQDSPRQVLNANCNYSTVMSSRKGRGTTRKSSGMIESHHVVSNNNPWLRFHSYDPVEHEEKKRKLREYSKRNAYKGLHFRPSKYNQEVVKVSVPAPNMLSEKNLTERSVLKVDEKACSAHQVITNSKIPLTHFQVSSIIQLESNSLISTTNNIQAPTASKSTCIQFTHQNSRNVLPSINEILSLSKIQKAPHKMIHNSSLQIIQQNSINSDNFQLENLTLAPISMYF